MLRFLIFLFTTEMALAKISVNVPTEFPVYQSLEKLEAYGCAKTTLRVLLPLTHAEITNSILSDEQTECQAPEWLLIDREIAKVAALPGEGRVKFVSLFDKVPLLGQEATSVLPFSNLGGRPSLPGKNLYGEVFLGSESGKEWGFAWSVTPGFWTALDDSNHLQSRFYLHEGYFKLGYKYAEFQYGRFHPGFGNTAHGSLFLSDGTGSQSALRFSIRPHLLEGLFSILGPIAFETWISWLGEAPIRSDSKLWVNTIALRPWTFFEFGLLHAVQLGGAGAVSLEVEDLFKTFFYSRDPLLELKRRESTALHFGLWGPDHCTKIYTQLFFNQPGAISNWLSKDLGILIGLWFPKLGKADLRVEYVHAPMELYSHSLWRQGWSTEGTTLGHSIGSDAEAVYLDLDLPPLGSWRPAIGFTYESRNRVGTRNLATEWRYGGRGKVLNRWDRFELGVELRQQSIYNYQYTRDDIRHAADLYAELRYLLL